MTEHPEPSTHPTYNDRKIGLIIFGILEIGFGGLALLMTLLLVFVAVAAPKLGPGADNAMNARMMFPGILIYALIGAWFITMGLGSILARRWARALILVSSWIWLVGGISGAITMLAFMPRMYEQMARNGQLPEEALLVAKCVTVGFMLVFFVFIPGSLVLFYKSRHVKATCEAADTRLRWTDNCPLPVLALVLVFASSAACLPMMGVYGWAIPFFGTILTGPPALVVVLVAMALSISLAWGAYKLNIMAWWGAAGSLLAYAVSASITFSRVSLLEFYEKMGFPEQQLEMMRQMEMPQEWVIAGMSMLWLAVFLGYLLYTKKYFTSSTTRDGV